VIPLTPERFRKQARRLDRRVRSREFVVKAMRGGNALHLYYALSSPVWVLTDGTRVDTVIAEAVIKHPGIVSVGDALFAQVHAQTYRFVETTSEEC
jgi:hypothetical protein